MYCQDASWRGLCILFLNTEQLHSVEEKCPVEYLLWGLDYKNLYNGSNTRAYVFGENVYDVLDSMTRGLWMTYCFSGVKSTLPIPPLCHFSPCMVISFLSEHHDSESDYLCKGKRILESSAWFLLLNNFGKYEYMGFIRQRL